MGLKLGRFLGKALKTAIPVALGFAAGGPAGAFTALAGRVTGGGMARRFAGGGQIGGGIPSIQDVTGVSPFMRLAAQNGEIVPAAAGAVTPFGVVGMSKNVAMAITKIAVALGIPLTLAKLSRVGVRLYRTIASFARRHPSISIISWLLSFGLIAEEAAEFMFWGASKQRRRRGRGISARDIRISRRTIRKVAAFQRDLVGLHRHPRALRGRGGVQVVRAG